jgi:hypothetical protein
MIFCDVKMEKQYLLTLTVMNSNWDMNRNTNLNNGYIYGEILFLWYNTYGEILSIYTYLFEPFLYANLFWLLMNSFWDRNNYYSYYYYIIIFVDWLMT